MAPAHHSWGSWGRGATKTAPPGLGEIALLVANTVLAKWVLWVGRATKSH